MNEQLSDRILNILSDYGSEVSLSEISAALGLKFQKRTIQRRLQQLITEKLIIRHGRSRSTRYSIKVAPSHAELVSAGYIPLSKHGEAIRRLISKPLSERQSIVYKKSFLYDYIPNSTFYIKPEVRDYLKNMGKQPDGNKPAATFANQILSRLLVDLSWNSSRLEGNTYSLLDTQRLVELGHAAEGKNAFETRMILNHKAAIEFLVDLGDDLIFDRYVILNLHALLSYNLLGNPGASGQLRTIPVSIGKTAYQPITIPQLIKDHFSKILTLANAIKNPFEQLFFAMVHLPYLQPFVDVNKRVSRLAANIPLIKNNYCPISFADVPKQAYIDGILGIYELNQIDLLLDVFVWAYERSTLRYSETRAYLIEPNLFIERYANDISYMISQVVSKKLSKKSATHHIDAWAQKQIPKNDKAHFIEVIETELLALHEGNIAKYKIKPIAFYAWQKIW